MNSCHLEERKIKREERTRSDKVCSLIVTVKLMARVFVTRFLNCFFILSIRGDQKRVAGLYRQASLNLHTPPSPLGLGVTKVKLYVAAKFAFTAVTGKGHVCRCKIYVCW